MGWGGSPGAGVEKASGRQSHWRRHLEGKATGLWSSPQAFGRPPQWFRKGKQGRNRGLVSSVLQIIDIPQLKLSTFTGGGRNSDAEEAATPAAERIQIWPRQPPTHRPWSCSASPWARQQPAKAGNGIAGARVSACRKSSCGRVPSLLVPPGRSGADNAQPLDGRCTNAAAGGIN